MGLKASFKNWWNNTNTSEATETLNFIYVIAVSLIWLIGIIIVSNYYFDNKHGNVFGQLLFFSAAALLIGILGGFLFGIPKTLQHSTAPAQTSGTNSTGLMDRQVTNTNLEQISDWLTKIIVGLGLINIKNVPQYLEQLRLYFASAFVGYNISISYCTVAIVIYAVISGFIFMYLYTRINISSLFIKSSIDEQQLLNDVINKLQTKGNEELKVSFINKLNQ